MKEALKQAHLAYNKGEVPVGCVIAKNNKVIAQAYNKLEKENTRNLPYGYYLDENGELKIDLKNLRELLGNVKKMLNKLGTT